VLLLVLPPLLLYHAGPLLTSYKFLMPYSPAASCGGGGGGVGAGG